MSDSLPSVLIKAKLYRPPVPDGYISRRRLSDQLDRALHVPLTVVTAGAGFGKTTSVSSWLDGVLSKEPPDKSPSVAWLSLDELDNDLRQFLLYFIAAVRAVSPGALGETSGLLERRLEPSSRLLAAVLGNDLVLLPRDLVLVLDDYHLVRGRQVHELINELLQHWPRALHLVLISRHVPPLSLARLRAHDEIVELRNRDLRFTDVEASTYLQRTVSLPLTSERLSLIAQRTEGWIVALQLVSMSLRQPKAADHMLDTLSGSNVAITEYLATEVLSRQAQEVQDFLLKTAILDRVCASLGEAVTGIEDRGRSGRSILDYLEREQLFLTSLDHRREWYRFHPLFRDFLLHRLSTTAIDTDVAGLHRRAATWFADQGTLTEGVRHALAANDLDLAAHLMEQGLPVLLNAEDRLSLEHWLNMLPEHFAESRAAVMMIRAWTLHFAWQVHAASTAVRRAEALLEQDEKVDLSTESSRILRGQVTALKCQEAFLNGHPALCVDFGWQALELLPRSWTYVRGGTMLYLGLGMQACGDGVAAEQILLERYESLLDKENGYALRLLLSLCLIYVQEGRIERTKQTADLILQQAQQNNLQVLQGWAHYLLGWANYQWNDLPAAEQHFTVLVEMRNSVHTLTAHNGMVGLGLVHCARGRLADAWNLLALLDRFDLELNGRIDDSSESLRARLLLASGDVAEAGRWSDTYSTDLEPVRMVMFELPQLTRVRVLLARRSGTDIAQALHELATLMQVAESNHNLRRKIEILSLQALALEAAGDSPSAYDVLRQVVAIAEQGGFVRIFVDLGEPMREPLAELVRRGSTGEFIQRILLAFAGERSEPNPAQTIHAMSFYSQFPTPTTPASPIEPLTGRETQVLRRLREPMSIKEIALQMNITYATAKRHTINLYSKLGVGSRWDAVAKGETLNMLPPR